MKHDKHRIFSLALAFAAAVMLGGCGGGGGGNGDDDDDDGGGGGGGTNAAPVADAGADQDASRLFAVTLNGSDSSDADGDALTYTWTQTQGPDVTGGAGTLSGVAPVFQPTEVGTLIFDLVVNDGTEDSAPATTVITVLENQNAAFFVDGDNGSDDTGTGSRDNPFQSIAEALCEVTADQQDVYVMTRAAGARYDETATDTCPTGSAREGSDKLTVPTGTSLYGGYDSNWQRAWQPSIVNPGDSHIVNPTAIDISHLGLRFDAVDVDTWLSGFDIDAADSPDPGTSASAVSADNGGAESLYILDNTIVAGDVPLGDAANPGSSYAVRVALSNADSAAFIERNIVFSGFGGDGQDVPNTFNQAAVGGSDATGTGGADGANPEDYDGGGGGAPGTAGGENGSTGARGQGPGGSTGGLGGCGGGAGSSSSCNGGGSDSGAGQNGYGGASGAVGGDGAAGSGGTGAGALAGATFVLGSGQNGARAAAGRGGGGGGGGEASTGVDGGRGGGGGGGGTGGQGGPGGPGGGASIGISIASTTTAEITGNLIDSGFGGAGGAGGVGQIGGAGGTGSNGNSGNSSIFGTGGTGGRGGNGGRGGEGGAGGGGGGGPSFGVLVAAGIAPVISGNTVSSNLAGDGGAGGSGAITNNGNAGDGGEGGYSYALFDVDPNDTFVPQASNNTLSFGGAGAGGAGGAAGSSAGAAGDPGAANVQNW